MTKYTLEEHLKIREDALNDPFVQDTVLLLEELKILRTQRMQPERERELLEANNRYLERARAAEAQLAKHPTPLADQSSSYSIALGAGDRRFSAGTFGGKPAMFCEPCEPREPGTIAAQEPGTQRRLEPGSLVVTCEDHRSGVMFMSFVMRMLAQLRPKTMTDDDWLTLEAAQHYGLAPIEVGEPFLEEGYFVANHAQILALVGAARLRGQQDAAGTSFQKRNTEFITRVAGDDPTDLFERTARFLEEAMEAAQSLGITKEEAHQLLHYVWERPAGHPPQEIGGVFVTLAGMAEWAGYDMIECGEREMKRCDTAEVIAKIRSKRAGRDKGSVLPGPAKLETSSEFKNEKDWSNFQEFFMGGGHGG